jgi:hypothetical protein
MVSDLSQKEKGPIQQPINFYSIDNKEPIKEKAQEDENNNWQLLSLCSRPGALH